MKNTKPIIGKELSATKRIIFKLILIVFPFLLLLLIEFSLRLLHYGQDFNLFINHPDTAFNKYKIVNPEIGAKYFRQLEYTRPKNDLFLKEKDKNSIRIFVMGSSTVVGFPYESNLMFSRILQSRLQEAYPDRRIEMINTAITAINSYTLLDFTNDILAEKPDAILIYAGHNEYYGAFGTGSNEGIGKHHSLVLLHLKLMDSRLYQLMRNIISKFYNSVADSGKESKRGTLMNRIVRKAEIVFQSDDYNSGINQFNKNINAILEKASGKRVPVFISTVVSNIRDIRPFGSASSSAGESAEEFYIKAQNAEAQGDFKLAKELYTKARDFDCVRFRASSDINTAIEKLAKKHHAFVVPMLEEFETVSLNSLVGNNLITEHVHPNISGYFLMADVFYKSITSSKVIGNEINKYSSTSATSFKKKYGCTALDSLLGHHLIENLKCHWPFRDESKTYIDYREIYKPKNWLDSLAFSIMKTKNSTSLDAHLQLAKKYISQKDMINAYQEYNTVVQIAPATPEILRKAADFFIASGDLPKAYKSFLQSLEFVDSYYAFFRAGEICLIKNDLTKAAYYFTKAFKISDSEYKIRILTKLYIAYVYHEKKDEAIQVYRAIQQLQPGIKIQVPLKEFTFGSYIPVIISDRVKKSVELSEEKKTDEALKLLLASLELNDAPIVSKMIGHIYFQKQDFENAYFYMQKAYPWFKFEPAFLGIMMQVNLSCKNISEARSCLEQLKLIESKNPEIPELEKLLIMN
jgi:tetratricopeptide (TPR) repeat protein